MKISILGSGCATCKKLHEAVIKIVKNENIKAEVEYSTDVARIVELSLMYSPVLVIDGKPVELISSSEKDIKKAILDKTKQRSECKQCFCEGKC